MKDSLQAVLALRKSQYQNLVDTRAQFGREALSDLANEILRLEREIAAEAGEEYAVEYPLLTRRMAMSSRIHLLANDSVCALACEHGAGSTIIFQDVLSYRRERFSGESIEDHRLYGRGAEGLKSYEVKNSPWAESHGRTASHYLLFFKEQCVEVLAEAEPQWCMFPNFAEAVGHGLRVLGD